MGECKHLPLDKETYKCALCGDRVVPSVTEDGRKDDLGKLPHELVPADCEDMLAAVLQFGALVYEANNWQKVHHSRYYSAMRRHMNAWRKGEMFDKDSGLPHSAHALCCNLFILWQDLRRVPNKDELMAKVPEMACLYKAKKESSKKP